MSRTIRAVYTNGVFQPLEPVPCKEQERVILTVENASTAEENLFDNEFLNYCDIRTDDSVPIEDVRRVAAKISGSLANDIRADRDKG